MKSEIHPAYHPVVFVDIQSGTEYVSRSTMTSGETRDIDGVSHYVIGCDITSASHPFFTGRQVLLDTAGRIDRFRKKYKSPFSVPGGGETQGGGE